MEALLNDPQVKAALAFVLQHKLAAAGLALLASGAVSNVVARLLTMIPLGPWFALVRGTCASVSALMDHRFGRVAWKPFEDFGVKVICGTADAARDGFQSDNDVPPPVAPPSLEMAADKPSPLQTQPPAPPAS